MPSLLVDTPYLGAPRRSWALGANETSPWYLTKNPLSGGNVAVRPSGGTILVELTGSPESSVLDDNLNGTSNAISRPWEPGAVSSASDMDFVHTTAIRFTSVGAGGLCEIAE